MHGFIVAGVTGGARACSHRFGSASGDCERTHDMKSLKIVSELRAFALSILRRIIQPIPALLLFACAWARFAIVLHPWMMNWGATQEEQAKLLPGERWQGSWRSAGAGSRHICWLPLQLRSFSCWRRTRTLHSV